MLYAALFDLSKRLFSYFILSCSELNHGLREDTGYDPAVSSDVLPLFPLEPVQVIPHLVVVSPTPHCDTDASVFTLSIFLYSSAHTRCAVLINHPVSAFTVPK